MISNIPIAFVVARARSGTTLLQSLLDAHPEICAPIESKFILFLKSKYKDVKFWSNKTKVSFVDDLFYDRMFKLFWGKTKDEILSLFNEYEINTFSDACKLVLFSYYPHFNNDIKLLVDKNPIYSICENELIEVFPEAKFIHMIREPYGNVASNKKAFKIKNIMLLSKEWTIVNKKMIWFKNQNSHSIIEVFYDSLNENPFEELERVFNFLEIKFNQNIFYQLVNKRKLKDKYFSLKQHENVKNKISREGVSNKNDLSNHEKFIVNKICNETYSFLIGNKQNITLEKLKTKDTLRFFLIKKYYTAPFFFRKLISVLLSFLFDRKYL